MIRRRRLGRMVAMGAAAGAVRRSAGRRSAATAAAAAAAAPPPVKAPTFLTSTTPNVVYATRPQDVALAPKTVTCLLITQPRPEKISKRCHQCSRKFSLFIRSEYCRNCGESVCRAHSENERRLPWFGITTSERVCDSCSRSIDSGEYEQLLIQQRQQQPPIAEAFAYVAPAHGSIKPHGDTTPSAPEPPLAYAA